MTETQEQWAARLTVEIWQEVRSRLYLALRYFGPALAGLTPTPWPPFTGAGTDGLRLLCAPDHALRLFENNRSLLAREYLHLVLHCLYRHLFQTAEKDPRLWGLCCDIAVESTLDGLDCPLTRRPLTWTRAECYRQLKQSCGVLAAGPIYRALSAANLTPEQYKRLEEEFRTDDHSLWPWDSQASPAVTQLAGEWAKRARTMQTDLSSFSKKQAGESGDLADQLARAGTIRRSYRDFLRKFCVLREEMHADPDSFDLGYYAYGLSLYGNLPLIEPLESRESFKVYELAIAIDTSMSCSGELVSRFLQETFSILQETDSFFHKVHLRILQCDDKIRRDDKITCRKEMEEYISRLRLEGGGGTDFRPVFTYLDYLIRRHEFHHLAGLLYFTDGMGRYPAQPPAWPTAFLFLEDNYDDSGLPPWAMRQLLYPDQWAAKPLPDTQERNAL